MEAIGKSIAKALVAFQSEVETLHKNAEGKVRMRSGGEYSYKYVDLPTLLKEIKPLLEKNELAVIQDVKSEGGGMLSVNTILLHSSGECICARVPIMANLPSPQGYGIAISYGRRYGLQATLGLSSEDDDAQSIEHNKQSTKAKAEPKPAPKATPKAPKEQAQKVADMFNGTVEDDVPEGIGVRDDDDFTQAGALTDVKQVGKQPYKCEVEGVALSTWDKKIGAWLQDNERREVKVWYRAETKEYKGKEYTNYIIVGGEVIG